MYSILAHTVHIVQYSIQDGLNDKVRGVGNVSKSDERLIYVQYVPV